MIGANYYIKPSGGGMQCEKLAHSLAEVAHYLSQKKFDPHTVEIKTDNGFLGRLYPISKADRDAVTKMVVTS